MTTAGCGFVVEVAGVGCARVWVLIFVVGTVSVTGI